MYIILLLREVPTCGYEEPRLIFNPVKSVSKNPMAGDNALACKQLADRPLRDASDLHQQARGVY